ncbi:MAG TPA: hypothetical protein VMI92_00865 [Steroidobacteraceae bacterium]|nr:hypothetical protein [Steroidobacteraceae bacterium]
MRRIAFFTVTALSCAAAFGQSLLDCIEPDVARTLLRQGQGAQQPPDITATVPAELSSLRMPREFTWIGSAERITGRLDATTNMSQVTAAWRTSLAPDAARAATAAALAGSGWEIRSQPGMSMNVFRSADQMPQTACRDGKPVNFTASPMDGVTYVLFTIQRNNNSSLICSQPAQPGFVTGLEKYTPHLDLPVDPATGVAVRQQGGGTSSGGGQINARTQFTLQDSPGNVARHFAKQMAGQGWTSDANWSGTLTAGSSWSRRDAGTVLQSTLSVTAVDEHQFVALLHISTLQ